jgi:pyruvate kinase
MVTQVKVVHQTHLLEDLLKCGMDIVRINIAHGTMNSDSARSIANRNNGKV